ncbi:MAG: chorismate mutase [Lancefieldella parvula]|jgi:chorismate mutase|uniref:Chorismate mutase n=1 Tax=Lancefieldella parvula TaxID=1382 RepID=A0A9D5X4P6_9ACTN|nr:chorismate mutase [Lancefieldella parvula]
MTNQLETLRQEIDSIDAQIFALFEQRLTVAKQIGTYKKEHELSVLDSSREDAKRDQVTTSVSNELEPYALELLEVLMKAAKAVQESSHEL